MAKVTDNSDNNVCTDETMEEDTPKHPYHLQLAEFQPNPWQLEKRQPQKYLPLEGTKLTMVDSQESLDEMMTKLKQVKEFAIDSVNHSYRSFIGFVCLIQISTRTEDFVVDTIKLKEEMGVFNEVCTDPNILKVFHDSREQILRLQRDFNIYVVNMFDTLEAAKNFIQKVSFVHILKEVCHIETNKKYYFEDWTVRPLPSDIINHAREGTHYLLYICDVYTNECLQNIDIAVTVYEKCTKLCGLVYAPPVFKEVLYKNSIPKVKGKVMGILTPRQLECFRLLYIWRYDTAKEHDESFAYTLPNKIMFHIAKELPMNANEFTTCCRKIPPLLEPDIMHVLTLVKKAIDDIPEEAGDKKAMGKSKAPGKNLKKKGFCSACNKYGHFIKDCRDNRTSTAAGPLYRVRKDPYSIFTDRDLQREAFVGVPRGEPRRGSIGGGYDNSHGDFLRRAYGKGYGSRVCHAVPPPYSSYVHDNFPGDPPTTRPLFQEYGPVRTRFGHY